MEALHGTTIYLKITKRSLIHLIANNYICRNDINKVSFTGFKQIALLLYCFGTASK